MFSLFNLFGRSAELKAVDRSLRAGGVHPVLVPEAVKLTILKLHKNESEAQTARGEGGFDASALLFAYCMLGREQFVESNSVAAADEAERRLEAAMAAGDSLDAQIVLLALHANLISADVAERIDVEKE